MSVVTAEEVKAYLGIDYDDDQVDMNISRMIETADMFLKGAIGEGYPEEDSRCKELALLYISDLYDNREFYSSTSMSVSSSVAAANNMTRLAHDLSLQLRLEMMSEANGS